MAIQGVDRVTNGRIFDMLSKIVLPERYNYIGVFLCMRCSLNCDYCINRFGELKQYTEMSGDDWVRGLSRIETRPDLPLSLQGGEPTLHPDFFDIVAMLCHGSYLDLLTNGLFDIDEFMLRVDQMAFKRPAPYASIRFSYHQQTSMVGLTVKARELIRSRYSVGIWGLDIPEMKERNEEMSNMCKWLGIDFRMKEYLDDTHGTYKYPDAIVGAAYKTVLCRPSELLIAPDGHIFRCHSDLYAGVNPVAHILDEIIEINGDFRVCDRFGECNPCDVKKKTDRNQVSGWTSVEIKDID
jgi:organic radical activating enzyme